MSGRIIANSPMELSRIRPSAAPVNSGSSVVAVGPEKVELEDWVEEFEGGGGKEVGTEFDARKEVEVEVNVGVDFKVMTEVEVEVRVETRSSVDSVVTVSISVTTDVSPGIKTVWVDVVVPSSVIVLLEATAPPGPEQTLPIWQHPCSPFEPRSQKVPNGQPRSLLGQHVSVKAMQLSPHCWRPCDEQGTGTTVWRWKRCGALSAPTITGVKRGRRRTGLNMVVKDWVC